MRIVILESDPVNTPWQMQDKFEQKKFKKAARSLLVKVPIPKVRYKRGVRKVMTVSRYLEAVSILKKSYQLVRIFQFWVLTFKFKSLNFEA